MKKIVIIGAALSGNKGAAGMVVALVQNLRKRHPDARFTLMSYSPEQDRKLNRYPNLEIIDGTPLGLILLAPMAIFAFIMKRMGRSPGLLGKHPGIKAVSECDLFLDAGGVSFVDGRDKFIPFNILWVFAPLLLGKTVIKASQALGPFHHTLNRVSARIVLPRIDLICARGEKTAAFLEELGLINFKPYPDIAFTLMESDARKGVLERYDFHDGGKAVVGVSPSQVVHESCMKKGIDYPAVMARFADRLLSENYDVALLPHSVRAGSNQTRNNDLPVLERIHSLMKHGSRVHTVVDELTPFELRALIGTFDLFIASRFHGMISALCMTIPTLVFGWSHKYKEVLKAFDMEEAALDYTDLNEDVLWRHFKSMEKEAEVMKKKIETHLPRVVSRAESFYDELDARLGSRAS